MQPKGKSSLAMWNDSLIDKEVPRGIPNSVATPLKRILGHRLSKGSRKTSNSRESNGHQSRAVQLDMPHSRQLLTEVSRVPQADHKYIVPSKYGQQHKNKMEELQGRIFKTHHLSSIGSRDDQSHQNHSLLFNSTLPQKRLPFGYYLPATMKNRSSGLRTYNSHTNHDSMDLDTYLMRLNRSRNPGNQTATFAYLDKVHRCIPGLLPKKKSSDKSPASQLNKTYDFADKLKPKSKHSRSSKKSRPGSLGAIDETEAEPGRSTSWRQGRRTSEQVSGAVGVHKPVAKSELKQSSAKNRKKSLSRGKYASTDNAEKGSLKTAGKSLDLYERLQKIYSSLKQVVEGINPHTDNSIQEMCDLFSQFVKLQSKIHQAKGDRARSGVSEDTESAISELSSKLIKYFSYYNKKYVKSYVYTRNLALKSLKVLEDFIGHHKVTISRYVPSFFTAREQVTLVDAVKMMKDLSLALLHENKQLASFIREQTAPQSKGQDGSKRETNMKGFGVDVSKLGPRIIQVSSGSAKDRDNANPTSTKGRKNTKPDENVSPMGGRPKVIVGNSNGSSQNRPSQSSDSKPGKKSKVKKPKQQNLTELNGKLIGKNAPHTDPTSHSPRTSNSAHPGHDFGSAEGVALEADIEGGDYYRGRELVKEMEDSAIMRFQSEEDYQRELGPSSPDTFGLGRTYPLPGRHTPKGDEELPAEKDPGENSSFDHAESSGDFVPVEALNNPELAKLLQQRAGFGPGAPPVDPSYGKGRLAPTVVVENDALKQKLKLNLPKVKATDGYHEEFMKHFDEFSPSWRDSLMKEKNSKYY